ncbi:hypothetical protein BVG19_g5038 [[Candida] boidinii]|nr:hypothetical protein BVG19_g5038 [[Candida] boidinii]OWB48605.1 hypothetical protein B5S27_g140 [[Candida] boidinii]
MTQPFSTIRQHRETVLGIYRNIIKNALNLPNELGIDKQKLVFQVQFKFRKSVGILNSITCQNAINDAIRLNQEIVNCYKNNELSLRELKIFTGQLKKSEIQNKGAESVEDYKEGIICSADLLINDLIKSEKANHYANLEEIATNRQRTKLKGWISYYIKNRQRNGLFPYKSKLDPKYIEEIVKPQVLYDRQIRQMKKLREKFGKPSTARLHPILGTIHPLIVINTPWNEMLKTQKNIGGFLNKQRKTFDQTQMEKINFDNYMNKNLWIYQEELKWEYNISQALSESGKAPVKLNKGVKSDNKKTIGKHNNNDPILDSELRDEWYWLFDYTHQLIQDKFYEIESDTKNFNKRQYAIFDNVKDRFDKFFSDSKKNFERLDKIVKNDDTYIGPFSSSINDNDNDIKLGKLMHQHGFKTSTKLDKLSID